MAELLKSPSGKKYHNISLTVPEACLNELCRGLAYVAKNDCAHVEHCNFA